MPSRVTKNPEAVNMVGERALDYLAATADYRLTFKKYNGSDNLQVHTDSSFAPSSGKSHGAAVVFYKECPLVWRSSRQPLVTLSTAESELIEAVEGALLGLSTQGLVEELSMKKPIIEIRVDNQSALALTTGSTGSWRTRHLRLRTNWLKERVASGEIKMRFEPGVSQRADLGTKALPKDRLQQLISLWGFRNARVCLKTVEIAKEPTTTTTNGSGTTTSTLTPTTSKPGLVEWIGKVALWCQVCGAKAVRAEEASEGVPERLQGRESRILEAEDNTDFYLVVLVIALVAIMLWELAMSGSSTRMARLQVLRERAPQVEATGRLSREELGEMQVLLAMEPGDLSRDEAERLLSLRTRFGGGRAQQRRRTSSSIPPQQQLPREPRTWEDPAQHPAASSSFGTVPEPVVRSEVGVQTDPRNFELLRNDPVPILRIQEVIPEGPYYHVPGREHVHLIRDCWGLRNASRTEPLMMCRCFRENDGRSMFGPSVGSRAPGRG